MIARLYAVEIDGETVLARARVLIPNAEERAEGLEPDVETVTVDGRAAVSVDRPTAWWESLWLALVAAESARLALAAECEDDERPEYRLSGADVDAWALDLGSLSASEVAS